MPSTTNRRPDVAHDWRYLPPEAVERAVESVESQKMQICNDTGIDNTRDKGLWDACIGYMRKNNIFQHGATAPRAWLNKAKLAIYAPDGTRIEDSKLDRLNAMVKESADASRHYVEPMYAPPAPLETRALFQLIPITVTSKKANPPALYVWDKNPELKNTLKSLLAESHDWLNAAANAYKPKPDSLSAQADISNEVFNRAMHTTLKRVDEGRVSNWFEFTHNFLENMRAAYKGEQADPNRSATR